MVETFERSAALYRFRRVEMPVFEKTEVFARSLGETTDVVSKEMYFLRRPRRGEPDPAPGIHRRDRAGVSHQRLQQYAPLKVAPTARCSV